MNKAQYMQNFQNNLPTTLQEGKAKNLLATLKPHTHLYRVLEHLIYIGGITQKDCYDIYGYTRLSDAIYKLRNNGLHIVSKHREGVNRYGDKVNFVEYKLEV